MKISFFIATYSTTGVPLAQIRLAKAFSRRGYDVEFIIGYIPIGLKPPCIKGIKTIVLKRNRVLKLIGPVIKYLFIKKPEIVFSAEDHMNVIVLISAILVRSRSKISVSSRISASRVYQGKIFSKNYPLKIILKLVQNRANALICVSQDMADEYNSIFNTNKYQCIYNVIEDTISKSIRHKKVSENYFSSQSVPMIISAGTLTKRKGFQDLILSMGELLKYVEAKLVILGDGPMIGELTNLIQREKLDSVVTLAGHKDNPLKYFSKSNVFVLSSYAEGLPNVLVEAIMCGCTPVSTDCPTGPREVLQDGKFGYLVPMHDPQSMANAIKNALENPITSEAIEEIVKPFTEEEVIKKHQEALGF